jgi:hypothetical protein
MSVGEVGAFRPVTTLRRTFCGLRRTSPAKSAAAWWHHRYGSRLIFIHSPPTGVASSKECPGHRKGSRFADVEPGAADRSEVGIYQIRDGKNARSQTFHADPAGRGALLGTHRDWPGRVRA